MIRSAHSVALSLALSAGAIIMPCFTFAQEHPVVAEDLVKLRASGKVITALWTARKDVYTLQLVLPLTAPLRPTGSQAARQITAASARPQAPHIQVWLLRTDGMQILPINQSPPTDPARSTCLPIPRSDNCEASYTFSLAGGSQAIAAAVMINDDFYIDRLTPLIDWRLRAPGVTALVHEVTPNSTLTRDAVAAFVAQAPSKAGLREVGVQAAMKQMALLALP